MPRKELATAAARKAAPDNEGQLKGQYKPATAARRDISKDQKTTEVLLRKKAFNRLVRVKTAKY